METWKERLILEQKELKEKFIKLMEFINSEKFYKLSDNTKRALVNQKIAMELYLSTLNIRVYEDIDSVFIPDYSTLSAFSTMFSKPFIPQS